MSIDSYNLFNALSTMAKKCPKVSSLYFPWKCISFIISNLSDDTQLFGYPSHILRGYRSCWGHFSAYLSRSFSCQSLHCPLATRQLMVTLDDMKSHSVSWNFTILCLCLYSCVQCLLIFSTPQTPIQFSILKSRIIVPLKPFPASFHQ